MFTLNKFTSPDPAGSQLGFGRNRIRIFFQNRDLAGTGSGYFFKNQDPAGSGSQQKVPDPGSGTSLIFISISCAD